MRVVRTGAVLLVALAAVLAAIVAMGRLQAQATATRDAQLQLTALRLDVAQIQDVPWGAAPGEDDPADVQGELEGDEQGIRQSLARLQAEQGLPGRAAIYRPLNRSLAALWTIFRLVSHGHRDATDPPSERAARQAAAADRALQAAAARYRAHAAAMLTRARVGSGAVIVLLFAAFAWSYLRVSRARRTAERLAGENRALLVASRREAVTDALTGLGNRRALAAELQGGGPLMLALFDLNGFKQYNDTFGHPAGDALLARLGERLRAAMEDVGAAYRMGGDEFCVTARLAAGEPEAIAARAAAALSERGEGFAVSCAYGVARLGTDGDDPDAVLQLADRRLYENKAARRGEAPPEFVAGLAPSLPAPAARG
jgi:diguanylate cyclase (GGDEF)-like protein